MSWWDKAYREVGGAADRILEAYTDAEVAKASSFVNAHAEQVAARHVSEVEYQNQGDPISVKPATQRRELVGETPKDSAVIDKKMLYIGGGALVLIALVGIAMASKR
ncbi:MAG: hypothetical protein CMI08_07495 [Oceanospirillaceae bacterium]|uniref:hypothetical protein n=1 Tax=unclassified Thalassolituus TaxID=2624967 RepID=UPI000C429F32|nr:MULTISPECIES: hypothetical protein [unclassified Thalassolituus]MAS26275.1 hypothetical protein [Oceanospirillaceae bacterium]MAX99035.1 hypothetical protein [Oceanospirillaceae bacterium]MBS53312.1 hypothetical protein [Oceanospirillaceae bacterium]|tara:strand:- start:2912 stop:3232 length:321 start_codon:yes stop_codon:yes gene_type:complete